MNWRLWCDACRAGAPSREAILCERGFDTREPHHSLGFEFGGPLRMPPQDIVYDEKWQRHNERHPGLYDRGAGCRRLLDALHEADVTAFSVHEALEAAAAQDEPLYYALDGHLNPAGNRVVAQQAAEVLAPLLRRRTNERKNE